MSVQGLEPAGAYRNQHAFWIRRKMGSRASEHVTAPRRMKIATRAAVGWLDLVHALHRRDILGFLPCQLSVSQRIAAVHVTV